MTSARALPGAPPTTYLAAAPRIFCAAPTVTLSLQDALRQLAGSAWAEVEAGDRVGLRLGEEALTDYLLMRLAGAVPDRVSVQKYRRHEEAQHGADYEFGLGNRGRFARLRIQAKRLDLTSPIVPTYRYKELWKIRKKSARPPTYQFDALMAAARGAPLQAFPVYAFYNAWDVGRIGAAASLCKTALPQVDLLGWTLVPARLIGRLPRTAAGPEVREVNPWAHSVACCIGEVDAVRRNTPLADAVQQRFNRMLDENEATTQDEVAPAMEGEAGGLSDRGRVVVHEGVDELPPHLERLFARGGAGRDGPANNGGRQEAAGASEDPELRYSVLIRDDTGSG